MAEQPEKKEIEDPELMVLKEEEFILKVVNDYLSPVLKQG